MQVRLHRSLLTYAGLTVHTASSGPVEGLDTLLLELDDGTYRAIGEVRINCAYLNGYEPDYLLAVTKKAIDDLDWDRSPSALRSIIAESDWPAPVRMLLDIALWDLSAKRCGAPLAHLLGTQALPIAHATNQTLFLSDDAAFDAKVARYVERGFRELKLRVGQDIAADCARAGRIRAAHGSDVTLAADANGAWSADEAPARLAALAAYNLAYVEQPIAAGDFDAMATLAGNAPMPLMLDESLASLDDVDALATRGPQSNLQGHLKLIKLGGLTPALAAADKLAKAGIPFMIGQMNEGTVATAAALHLAVATRPLHAELYGADGLVNDPAEGLTYADGQVSVAAGPGLGLNFRAPSAPLSLGE